MAHFVQSSVTLPNICKVSLILVIFLTIAIWYQGRVTLRRKHIHQHSLVAVFLSLYYLLYMKLIHFAMCQLIFMKLIKLKHGHLTKWSLPTGPVGRLYLKNHDIYTCSWLLKTSSIWYDFFVNAIKKVHPKQNSVQWRPFHTLFSLACICCTLQKNCFIETSLIRANWTLYNG